MKIGLVCPYNIFKNGGVQECVLALRAEYEKRGHQAYIITPRPRGVEVAESEGILLVGQSRDFNAPFQATTTQVSVTFDNAAIDALLEQHKFDVLHYHEPWVPIVGRQILTRSNTANVATFHAKLPETIMTKSIEKVITPYTRSILKYIDSFTAVSDAAKDYIQSLTDEPIEIVPNGIDISKYSLHPSPVRDESTILYVGRLEKRKGVKYLLEAFVLLKAENPDARLIIAGDGPERKQLEDFVKTNKLADVEFLGFVDDSTKVSLLNSCTIYCSPAMFGESFGIVLLEAMAAGAVTVAGSNPGYSSVLKEKGAISLVNTKDSQEFARRLQLLMTDTDIRSLWLQWAKTYVKQFEYTKVADRYLTVYEEAMKAHIS
jgi:phosphatidylinositol alpha-mannosyltransferase